MYLHINVPFSQGLMVTCLQQVIITQFILYHNCFCKLASAVEKNWHDIAVNKKY